MTQSGEVARPIQVSPTDRAELILALALTGMVVALHVFFLSHVGGLFRDEVNLMNLAQGNWAQMTHDSFPILYPLCFRMWAALGLANSDQSIRFFGALMGLSVTVAYWLAANWLRQKPPLWSLSLGALNAWLIYYGAWLRAYGLGSAMIVLCVGAAWLYLERSRLNRWLWFALTATLSVQALYQNTALVAAVCAGGCAVCLRRRDYRTAGGIFMGGLVAAISLLPYVGIIAGMPQAASPLRLDFDRFIAWRDLNTVLAYPLPQFFWVWGILAAVVLGGMIIGLAKDRPDDRSLFAGVVMVTAVIAFVAFLRAANFPVQPWYFLPLVSLVVMAFEAALPRLTGKWRAPLWGGLVATGLMSGVFAIKVLDYRFTNVDLMAKAANRLAGRNDLVIVGPWQFGITFGHYFTNPCPWTTVPPIADHSGERYDLLINQMRNTNAMLPLLTAVSNTLEAGHTVWIVGAIPEVPGNQPPGAPSPPPLPHSGWNETPYRFAWLFQLGWLARAHSVAIESVDTGTNTDVNPIEQLSLFKVTGWKEK
jgi:hypothetical protein